MRRVVTYSFGRGCVLIKTLANASSIANFQDISSNGHESIFQVRKPKSLTLSGESETCHRPHFSSPLTLSLFSTISISNALQEPHDTWRKNCGTGTGSWFDLIWMTGPRGPAYEYIQDRYIRPTRNPITFQLSRSRCYSSFVILLEPRCVGSYKTTLTVH
jgi:hypothetical protein